MLKTRYKVLICLLCALFFLGLAFSCFHKQAHDQVVLEAQTDLLLEQIEKGETLWIPEANLSEVGTSLYDGEETTDIIPLPYEGQETPSVQKLPIQAPNSNRIEALGILEIDAIGLKLPISYGASENSLKVSPGWIPQTSVIGELGNAVIAGHRNYKYGSQFNRLGELKEGDILSYTRGEQKLRYSITEILEVLPGDSAPFEPVLNQSMLTLYTCTPIRTATHRLVIRATLLNL